MTDAQYNEVIDLLRKVERLVRSAAPPGYVTPLRTPDDHVWQTPAHMPVGYSSITGLPTAQHGVQYDWHTSGYISPAEAHG